VEDSGEPARRGMGSRLRQVRDALRLSQTEMAPPLGHKQQSLSYYETCEEIPEYLVLLLHYVFKVRQAFMNEGVEPMFAKRARVPRVVSEEDWAILEQLKSRHGAFYGMLRKSVSGR
jgi:hypothetical protein